MGRDRGWSDNLQASRGFNPRARMGRDDQRSWLLPRCLVSIHAPAWGATGYLVWVIEWGHVSIHAPAWGATEDFWKDLSAHKCFNPRARMGRDTFRPSR